MAESDEELKSLLMRVKEENEKAGYKVNIQKLVAFLYTNNERSEREIQETIPSTIPSKIIKYLGINLPKGYKKPIFQ